MRYEYRVVPAPERGERVKGVKGAEGRFAAAVERVMNDMAARGWEYLRSDTLPSEERTGLTSTQTVWRNLLVFRRPAAQGAEDFRPRLLEPPSDRDGPTPVAEGRGTARRPSSPARALPEDDTIGAARAVDDEDAGPTGSVFAVPGALRARAARLRSTDG